MTFLASNRVCTLFLLFIILPVYGIKNCHDGVQLFLNIDEINVRNFIEIRKSKSKPIIIDIGGEGNNFDAININPQRYTSNSDNMGPIPLWVKGIGESIPVRDKEVDQLILENTPLNDNIIDEIIRVIKKDGTIRLVHPIEYAIDTHSKFSVHFPHAKVFQKRIRHGLLETVLILKP